MAGMVNPKPMALVYIRPRIFFCTQRSDKIPPNITPRNDEKAIVIVDKGPAFSIGVLRFSENNVGNQFLVAQPGKLGTAKSSKITQHAIFDTNTENALNKGTYSTALSSDCERPLVSSTVNESIRAYITPTKPKNINVFCQL